jgi:hypothetical protein
LSLYSALRRHCPSPDRQAIHLIASPVTVTLRISTERGPPRSGGNVRTRNSLSASVAAAPRLV